MQQIFFHIPILKSRFPPDGIPVHGFGVMLFITFIACVTFLVWRARRTGVNLPRERATDLVIAVFLGGLIGARLTYMVQYKVPFEDIYKIWEGGIVLYGGIVLGALSFIAFQQLVLKRVGVSLWRLADVSAPGVALGIALGRVGCLLNGCCYGHVAPEDCPSAAFPLLTCPARDVVVDRQGYQTPTGFSVKAGGLLPQSVVEHVEPRSAAEKAGLRPDDRIMAINGDANAALLILVSDNPTALEQAVNLATGQGAEPEPGDNPRQAKLRVPDEKSASLKNQINGKFLFAVRVVDIDVFTDKINNWPRGGQSITLDVVHIDGSKESIGPFTPRTVGLHPTQVYETVSMILLMLVLLAYHPFRAYDGQIFTLFLALYAVHRFLNEALRNDTDVVGIPSLHMSLSQNISVLMLVFAATLEVFHRVRTRHGGTPVAA